MVERCLCKADVRGSSPLISILLFCLAEDSNLYAKIAIDFESIVSTIPPARLNIKVKPPRGFEPLLTP